ncbi:hypothetical protein RMATCC62417_12322 [Rhizopus microsporus]|nr:hypothetical protein RMATCC62417_12322 [Rhizopus microsporus]
MKRKKDENTLPSKAKRDKGKATYRGFPSLFAFVQTNLFKYTSFEASGDDFIETLLLRKDKNVRTSLKAAKEDKSALSPSNVVTSEKTSMPIVNNDMSVEAVLHTPTPSTSLRLIRLKHLKEERKEKDNN